MNRKTGLVILMLCSAVMSCKKSGTGGGGNSGFTVDCTNVTNKAYSADVSPIITTRCAISGCHGGNSTNGPGELITYSEIFNNRAKIRAAIISGQMPQNSSLIQDQVNSIICWIDSGAPNN